MQLHTKFDALEFDNIGWQVAPFKHGLLAQGFVKFTNNLNKKRVLLAKF